MQNKEAYKKQQRDRQRMIRDAVRDAEKIDMYTLNAFIYGQTTNQCKMELKNAKSL